MNLREEFEYYFEKTNTNLCSFNRDYYDVDNFYNLIQIGTRVENKEYLIEHCWRKLNDLSKNNLIGTPDFGGVLCVIMYNDADIDVDTLRFELVRYLKNMDNNNPHCIRWAISLTYKMGELYYSAHNIVQAKEMFLECLSYDFKKFNSLIISKQMMSCEKLARIYLNMKKNGAIQILNKGLELYREAISHDLDRTVGSNGNYIYFGCVEMAELCDLASQLVKFLQNIDIYGTEKFEEIFEQKRFGLLRYCQCLEKKIKELRSGTN